MMQVEIFISDDIKKLQSQINEFITSASVVEVVDIKYTSAVTTEYWAEGERTANESQFTAMVIYKQ